MMLMVHERRRALWRSRWAAVGAAVAVSLGVAGVGLVRADLYGPGGPVTVTIEPARIVDTRSNLGLAGRSQSGVPRELEVTGSVPVATGGTATVVPAGAAAVLVNVTVAGPDSSGYLSLRPGGSSGAPTTSTVNFRAGTVEPNAATVALSPGGTLQIYLFTDEPGGSAHVLLDVVGYTYDHYNSQVSEVVDEVTIPADSAPVFEVDCGPNSIAVSGGHSFLAGGGFAGDVLVSQSFRGGWGTTYEPSVWAFEFVNFGDSAATYLIDALCSSVREVAPDVLVEGGRTWVQRQRSEMPAG